MKAKRQMLDDGVLLEYSKEHVYYEIWMTTGCWDLLQVPFASRDPILAHVLRFVVIEGFAWHLRNLVDFFYPGTNIKADDVLAADYCIGSTLPVQFPSLSSRLRLARERAHKEVAHLTTGRKSGSPPGKAWADDPMVMQELWAVLDAFVAVAISTRLDRSVIDFISKEGLRFRAKA